MSNQRVEIRTVHSLTDGEAIQLMREIERLYLQMAPKQMSFMVPAEPEGTEHYADVWQRARSMGYANVTDALVELERIKAAPPAAAHGDEAVLWELLDKSVYGIDEQQVVARAKIRRLLAMRAQGDGGEV